MTNISEKQAEAVRLAAEGGYFEIPRDVSMSEIADELDICGQAASERLRRGIAKLISAETPDGGTLTGEYLRCVSCESPVLLTRVGEVGHWTCDCVAAGDIEPVRANELADLPERWLLVPQEDDDD